MVLSRYFLPIAALSIFTIAVLAGCSDATTDPSDNGEQDTTQNQDTGKYSVGPVTPNPASSSAEFTYALAFEERVKVVLIASDGTLLRTLVDAFQPTGYHTLMINVSDMENGTYYIRFEAGGFIKVVPFVVAK